MEEETAILVLVPFGHQPVIAFENIKLGHGAIRKLAIQNPSSKQIQVCIHNISTRTQRQLSRLRTDSIKITCIYLHVN